MSSTDLNMIVQRCLQRLRRWHVPPHWSCADWQDEATAQAHLAAWEALGDYDASRGVPLSAFVHVRVMTRVLTRYRQEWNYALHCACQVDEEEYENVLGGVADSLEEAGGSAEAKEWLCCALALLSHADRWLIEQLFWIGRTEAEIAQLRGISQPAINKRKRVILHNLREWMDPEVKV